MVSRLCKRNNSIYNKGGIIMITLAAIGKDGIVYIGKRHAYILNDNRRPKGFLKNGTQGFITDKEEFVDREQAAIIAFKCGQIDTLKKELFSEDIIEVTKEDVDNYNKMIKDWSND
jgi:hypothetical protein